MSPSPLPVISGYDSAGVGLIEPAGDGKTQKVTVVKKAGKVANLRSATGPHDYSSTVGIAHTRWATHGPPNDSNAHPHTATDFTVAVVHNGIIENFTELKTALRGKGYTFSSDTDTELLAHLAHEVRVLNPDLPLPLVVREVLKQVDGAYGCAFLFSDQPNVLVGARCGSPLILGIGKADVGGAAAAAADAGAGAGSGTEESKTADKSTLATSTVEECFLASDASAVIEYTNKVVYLDEGDMVTLVRGADGIVSYTIEQLAEEVGTPADRPIKHLDLSLDAIEKGGYKHFMLKEIMDQPALLGNCMRGRVNPEMNFIRLGGLESVMPKLVAAKRFVICACGTSYHSGLVGEYLLETIARMPVEVEYASEYRYRNPIINDDDVVIVISQSGETADTLAAVREAKKHGATVIGLVNVVGSTIARETDAGVYLHVGPEIGVASTKAFTGQVLVLTMMAIMLGRQRGLVDDDAYATYIRELALLPDKVQRIVDSHDTIFELSRAFRFAQSFLFLGRGYNFPVALEGALKLKEISYIHAEGYAAAEMKHGPIALIDKFMPVVVIAPKEDPSYLKLKSNMEEVLARGGAVIAVTEEGNNDLDGKAECVIKIPGAPDWLSPLLTVVPLQLLSYYIADMRKCNVDQPRNLAKSVTVE